MCCYRSTCRSRDQEKDTAEKVAQSEFARCQGGKETVELPYHKIGEIGCQCSAIRYANDAALYDAGRGD